MVMECCGYQPGKILLPSAARAVHSTVDCSVNHSEFIQPLHLCLLLSNITGRRSEPFYVKTHHEIPHDSRLSFPAGGHKARLEFVSSSVFSKHG